MSDQPSSINVLQIGAAYYPEHWPEERWAEEIQLIRAANLTVVRMAEFAWSVLEPAEGQFSFDWLERAIQKLAEAGIASVLGTPTAGPPAWLVQRYPDILTIDKNGRKVQFGNRCHYCVTSPDFHTAVQRIVRGMAERFGSNPNVIGWQLDNEYWQVCYCERCQRLFQQFLAQQYGSLEELNEHWTTRYWSQTYSAWEQIQIPIGGHNPGLMLEFKRFITENYRRFQRLQLDALRPSLRPGVWVTHNFMGWHDGFDHYTLNADLDMASWDWYIGTGHHDYLTTGAIHDLTRGFLRKNFWVMETQPGSVNWSPLNNSLDKGEARAMAWHAVAHGAEAIVYWQWRSALNGQEQYHGTIVDQSGQPRPFYNEVQQLGGEFARLRPLFTGATLPVKVAMLNDYESRWSIQWQRHHKDFDYVTHFNHYYHPLAEFNVAVDVLGAKTLNDVTQLAGYSLVIAPCLLILDDRLVKVLLDYVAKGGHLVLTLRSGMKDRYNALLPSRQPGPLAEAAGVEVEEYFALVEPVPVKGNWLSGSAQIWAERLRALNPRATSVIAYYGKSNGWLDDQIAVSVKTHGQGLIYYVGAYFDEATQRVLLERILKTARVTTIHSPAGVEIRTLQAVDGKDIYLVINHKPAEQELVMPWASYDHLSGHEIRADIKLPPYGVVILTPLATTPS